ncbi:8-oxoguanine-DNA glycosylase family protein [Hibiscus syriacus]|uniref:8-oxoguanine-DNA glycosylase family protein n=1 Tax=Hibiscus syriacus TaxID=106335 RepID=A0A6A3CKS7_HIBSY|nr:8-oxoguanine-DNA glycosylase family protein [Hibiscus syriacus]
MSKTLSPEPREWGPLSSSNPSESNETNRVNDSVDTVAPVARFIEQLHVYTSSPSEKKLITSRVVVIARARKEARTLIGSHGQAMPLFISILRSGTPSANLNVASTLTVLCKDEDLRQKVLLGECIPPLFSLLKSESTEARKAAAEAIFEVSFGGLSDDHVVMKIFVTEGVVPTLWEQLSPRNKQDKVVKITHTSVRSSAADALEALSSMFSAAKKAVVDANGVPILIRAVVAPSKECMQGEHTQSAQHRATHDLANISGGMSDLILYLGKLSPSSRLDVPVADIVGALAYALMLVKQTTCLDEEPFDAAQIEDVLVMLLRPCDNMLVQDRILEATASLYGNTYLSLWLNHAEEKRVLIGLITIAAADVQEHLILSLTSLCCDKVFGMLLVTEKVDDSQWAITVAGGIPPLVQLLELSSRKAREDAAHILWNLCSHSEDIRACVESEDEEFDVLNPAVVLGGTIALWFYANVVLSPATTRIMPSLAFLLRSEEIIDRYFAAHVACLVCNGSKGISLAIANSGAVSGLITLICYLESDIPNLVTLTEEFFLVRNPVNLLRPIPDRPGAPPVSVQLLTRIADGSDANKLIMGEAGASDALTKYLSLSPQDSTEADICELLRILFRNLELIQYEASLSSLNQLIAVLRMGSKNARFSAVRALHQIFYADNIIDSELDSQAIQPLLDMMYAASESEQEAALVALIKLTSGNASKATLMTDMEGNPLESLHKILSSASSLELKRNAAQLCFVLFDNEQQVELAAAYDIVDLLVGLVSERNHQLARRAAVGSWIVPPSGELKFNVDVTVSNCFGPAGIGGVLRDHNGSVFYLASQSPSGCLIHWGLNLWLSLKHASYFAFPGGIILVYTLNLIVD